MVCAQSDTVIKFNINDQPSLKTDKNLVAVSAVIDAKQSASKDGIYFTLIVKNNSGKVIDIDNIADKLLIALYNESGFDVAIPNDALLFVLINKNPADRKWKFRSESVTLGSAYVNGIKEKSDLKTQEYIMIPAFGTYKVNLIIRKVKQVKNFKEVGEKRLKPTINLAIGKYKLKMWLNIFLKDETESGKIIASFISPMIDIDYSK